MSAALAIIRFSWNVDLPVHLCAAKSRNFVVPLVLKGVFALKVFARMKMANANLSRGEIG